MAKPSIIFLFTILLIIAIREGFIIKWALNNHPTKLSKIWHSLGMILRASIVGVILFYVYPDWKQMILVGLFGLNWAWTIYDASINIINGWPIWYVGKSSQIENIFNGRKERVLWVLKAIAFLVTIVYVVLYFTILN